MQRQTLIFLGPQGCGKGTQISLLKDYIASKDSTPIVEPEMGASLRKLAEADTFTGKKTKDILAGGNLIPFPISAATFVQYLIQHLVSGAEHLMIDGFPRTADQIPMLDTALQFFERTNPTVIVLNISDEEAVKRALLRGRADDTEENIRKRLAWSRQETMPNIEWFKSHHSYRVVEIFGERPIDEVQQDIRMQLGL